MIVTSAVKGQRVMACEQAPGKVRHTAPGHRAAACPDVVARACLDYEVINNMLMVTAQGTAVTLA